MERGLRKLAGKTVQGANGEKLGTIRDFVIDKKTGEVVYAVVASGGTFGAASRLRLIPIAALQPAPEGSDGFIIKIDRVSWERGPALNNEAFNAGIISVTEEQQRFFAAAFPTHSRASSAANVEASRPSREAITPITAVATINAQPRLMCAHPNYGTKTLHQAVQSSEKSKTSSSI